MPIDQNGIRARSARRVPLDLGETQHRVVGIKGQRADEKGLVVGYPPSSSVQIYFGSFLETIARTDSAGTFSTSFKIPVVPNSIYLVEAISGAYFSTKSFPVSAHLTVTPSSPVLVGSTITVSGTGFSANTQVSFNMGSIVISTKATSLADGTVLDWNYSTERTKRTTHFDCDRSETSNTAQARVSVSN